MVCPTSDSVVVMRDEDRKACRTAWRRFFNSQSIERYVLSNLKAGAFHIWYGIGSNGKTTLATIVSKMLAHMNPKTVDMHELINSPMHKFMDNKLLIVDWDWSTSIPANRVMQLLDSGHLVILMCNAVPLLKNPTDNLYARTHTIPFFSRFVHTTDDVLMRGEYVANLPPVNLMATYLARKMQKVANLVLNEPPHVLDLMERVKHNAIVTPAKPTVQPQTQVIVNNKRNAQMEQPSCNEKPHLVIQDEGYEAEENDAAETVYVDDESGYADITIVLQHRNSARPDDTLKIEVDPYSDGFIVTFHQRYIGSRATQYMTYDSLLTYLRIFFDATCVDSDGYSHVQFNTPLFPAVILDAEDAPYYADREFVDQINFLMEDWPCEYTVGPFALRK